MTSKIAAALLAFLPLCYSVHAAPTYQTVDVPGASATALSFINDAGEVGGIARVSGITHGFIRAVDGTITMVDPPSSILTNPTGINAAGETVGYFTPQAQPDLAACFIRSAAGVYTTFSLFGNPSAHCNATGINNKGWVAGYAQRTGYGFGFLLQPAGRNRFFERSNVGATVVAGLNNARAVVGTTLLDMHMVGFVRATDGTITTFSAPGGGDTHAEGINDKGAIVGTVSTTANQGFVRTPDGTTSVFTVPGATETGAGAINEKGNAIGYYTVGSTSGGGFMRSANGDINTFSSYTPFAINKSDVIVGQYFDAKGKLHGFIRTP